MTEKVKEPDEFFHVVGGDTIAIGLRIPIEKIKYDINSAIKKVEEAGFKAEVRNYSGYEYLEIRMKVDITNDDDITKDDDDVVVKLVNVAMDVSKKEDSAKNSNSSSGKMLIEEILDDPEVQDSIERLRKEMRLLQELSELKKLKKSEEQG